jgi:hypothetical protein
MLNLRTHDSRAAATSPSPKGILSYAAERLVSSENASTGDRVVIASQFAQIAFFRKYVGKIGRPKNLMLSTEYVYLVVPWSFGTPICASPRV